VSEVQTSTLATIVSSHATPVEASEHVVFNSAYDFDEIFISANATAWKNIAGDRLLLIPQSSQGLAVVEHAKILLEHCDSLRSKVVLYATLKEMFQKRCLISESERESLMIDLQSLRLSDEAFVEFGEFFSAYFQAGTTSVIYKFLYQVWLRRLVVELSSSITSICVKKFEEKDSLTVPLSQIDQNVLFYIAGYLAMKVKRACHRFKNMKKLQALTECLATKEPKAEQHFVQKYKKWIETQSRGGLMYPIPPFYLLVREFDSIYRSCINANGLNSSSISKSFLQATMHSAYMVKYNWKQIIDIAHEDEANAMPALNYVISLFITIKGFAIARKESDRFKAAAERCKVVRRDEKNQNLYVAN